MTYPRDTRDSLPKFYTHDIIRLINEAPLDVLQQIRQQEVDYIDGENENRLFYQGSDDSPYFDDSLIPKKWTNGRAELVTWQLLPNTLFESSDDIDSIKCVSSRVDLYGVEFEIVADHLNNKLPLAAASEV